MPEGPATILGGLPVIAVIAAGTSDGPNGRDDWAEVEALYWMKKDGSKGKELPQHIRDRAEKYDYGLSDVIDRVFDHLIYQCKECRGTGVAEKIGGYDRPCDACKGSGVEPTVMVQLG